MTALSVTSGGSFRRNDNGVRRTYVTSPPTSPIAPDRALPVAAILALSLAHLLAMADRSVFSAIAPLLAQRYGFTNTQLGILLGPALAVTYGIAAIGFGTLTDRSMPRTLVASGLAIMVAASAIMAFADGYAMLLAGRILLGLGQAALIPAAMVLVVRTPYGVARPQVLATFTGASALGRSGGLILAGLVLGAAASFGIAPEGAGWRILLLLTALPAIALLVACLRMLPVGASTIGSTIGSTPSATPSTATRDLIVKLAPQFAVAIGPILLGQSLAAWVPVLLIRQHHFAVPAAATFFGVILLVMGTGAQYLGGVMTARVHWFARRPILANALCLLLAQPFLMLATRSNAAWAIGTGLAGVTLLGGLAAFVTLYAVQALSPPARRGAVTGLFLSLVTLVGAGSGPLLTGVLSDTARLSRTANNLGLALELIGGGAAAISLATVAVVAAFARAGRR